jgi:cytoskeletal protein RodZ
MDTSVIVFFMAFLLINNISHYRRVHHIFLSDFMIYSREMKPLTFNPYIVGNPIKSREMFFGREDDFQFVAKKIGEGRSNQIMVLCGERRSGKTSILFQILGGRLGEAFIPILIDMQMLAGIRGDEEFFRAILRTGCRDLDMIALEEQKGVEALFESFLSDMGGKNPGKIVLFLIDEYELIEAKILDGSLSESTVHYLAGILESPFRVSFIFTGSTNLEDRQTEVWKSLLGKSIYRKISYLSRNDTQRLITEPLKESLAYPEDAVESIYRLTGGQPFYTQVICQNMVDLLIEEGRNDPNSGDLQRIVREIVDNPLPQMIYSWNSVSKRDQVILAALAGRLSGPEEWVDGQDVTRYIKDNGIRLPFEQGRVNVILEDAYHKEFLEKGETASYRFRMDLFRKWIRREHSIWKAVKEAGLELKKTRKPALRISLVAAAAILALGLFSWFVLVPRFFHTAPTASENNPASVQMAGAQQPTESVQPAAAAEAQGAKTDVEPSIPAVPKPAAPARTEKPREANTPTPATVTTEEPEQQPPAVETQAAQTGILIINSTPAGAEVSLDGESTGKTTPYAESAAVGRHEINLSLTGYKTRESAAVVESASNAKIDLVLEKAYGKITLDVRPTADVYLDDAFLQTTPYLKPIDVQVGRHTITIKNEALKVNKDITIEVVEGKTLPIIEVLK